VKALRWGVAGPATCTDESGAGSSTTVARNSEEMKRIEGAPVSPRQKRPTAMELLAVEKIWERRGLGLL
jgi:hypothetical protein